jgi:hypothetical protein
VTIPAGQTTATITIQVNGDTAVEPDEPFSVTISVDPTLAQVVGNKAIGTIVNDDAAGDATPPLVTPQVSCSLPGNGVWCRGTVNVTWTVDDPDSTVSSTPGCAPTTISADTAAAGTTLTCSATSAGGSASASVTVFRDGTAPSVAIDAPASSPAYGLNAAAVADYACADSTSGVASCIGPVADGAGINTTTPGTRSFVVNASDQAGNTASVTRTYLVQYAPAGTACLGEPGHQVLQPINVDGTSIVKRKSTVPVKFRVCDATGSSVGTPGVVQSFVLAQVLVGDSGSVNETVQSTTADTAFRWSAADQQWIFNLKADLPANQKYLYRITLADQTTIEFAFTVK